MEPLVKYYRSISGEHPDWDDYRAAMIKQRRCLMRITPTKAGPTRLRLITFSTRHKEWAGSRLRKPRKGAIRVRYVADLVETLQNKGNTGWPEGIQVEPCRADLCDG
jgi:hypothetical protein